MVKRRKNGKTKLPSPCRRIRMICAINLCQDATLCESTRMKPSFLPFDAANLCNDCIFMDQKYNGQLCFLNQVDSNTDLLDNVLLTKVVI